MGPAEEKPLVPKGDAMVASGAVAGSRERAPAEGVTDSDVPTLTRGGRREHPEIAEERTRWWHPEMKPRINTQSRKDPAPSFVMDGGDRCYLRGLRMSGIAR